MQNDARNFFETTRPELGLYSDERRRNLMTLLLEPQLVMSAARLQKLDESTDFAKMHKWVASNFGRNDFNPLQHGGVVQPDIDTSQLRYNESLDLDPSDIRNHISTDGHTNNWVDTITDTTSETETPNHAAPITNPVNESTELDHARQQIEAIYSDSADDQFALAA